MANKNTNGNYFDREQWKSELSANKKLWEDPDSEWLWNSDFSSVNGASEEFVIRPDFKKYTLLVTVMKNLDEMQVVGSSPTEVAFIAKQGEESLSSIISINRLRVASVNRQVVVGTAYTYHVGAVAYLCWEIGKRHFC
ncbi:hypothetical protein K469DRAFT_702480 [Zopfia rhizophila CBS 207.26]|uniref:Uncharacterized protein n=1 Tax=Zopfia rhizophila CBS 207.26 TaxID=1314779 RepID=A0A6A6EDX6_9PEZI|nr:hypothetical protein K469DRAFT_702480 [Zopfia rhizophila CBS 207.26]